MHYFKAADSDNKEEKTMAVSAGKMVFIAKGERFKPNMFQSIFPPFDLIDAIGRKRRRMVCREVVMWQKNF